MNIIQSYNLNRCLQQFNIIVKDYQNHDITLKEKNEQDYIYTFTNGDKWKLSVGKKIEQCNLTIDYYYLDSTLFNIQDIYEHYQIEKQDNDHMIFF